MKRTLFLLLLSGALAHGASAQAGWGSSDGWGDTPKKASAKKTPAKSGKAQTASQDKSLQNSGAAAATPEPTPAPAAAPASDGFGPASGGGSGSSSASSAIGGMSVAPGTPVMMHSGRNVLHDEAVAARERRQRHQAGKPAAAPAPPAPVVETPPAAAAPAPANANADAGFGTASGGQAAASKTSKPVQKATKAPKKAPAEPSGW